MKARYLIPLAIFIAMLVFLGVGLKLDPREVPSPLIDKPAPAFRLQTLDTPPRVLSSAEMRGQVWLLNVWASWCSGCREEHPVLVELSKTRAVPIYGLDYKDQPDDARRLLNSLGNPYVASVSDLDGRTGIEFGVYGVPETFVIDKAGIIRHKQTGPITPEIWRDTILPLVKNSMLHKFVLPLLLAASLSPAFAKEAALAAVDPVAEARLMQLASELRCLVCQNQTIADSNADLAVDLRNEIREKSSPAWAMPRSRTSWSPATATSCCIDHRSRTPPCFSGSGPSFCWQWAEASCISI